LSPERKPSVPAAPPIVCYVTDGRSLRRPWLIRGHFRLALAAGADWVQIREKDSTARELLGYTKDALAVAPLVFRVSGNLQPSRIFINDRLDVALVAGAAGVHLGGESIPAANAIAWCRAGNAPLDFAVGVSCHTLEDAHAAETAGANYIFFGPVFDTPSKRSFGAPQGLDRLGEICAAVKIPVIAIGGVNESNAADCVGVGARGIAAIRMFQEVSDSGSNSLRDFIAKFHAL
jgi:thiamine-phosphate pyrophosphorylase